MQFIFFHSSTCHLTESMHTANSITLNIMPDGSRLNAVLGYQWSALRNRNHANVPMAKNTTRPNRLADATTGMLAFTISA